jgi:uncharacterized peroxidase-related enzyme
MSATALRAAPSPALHEAEPISRLGLPDAARLPPHYGFIPNWLSTLAANPDAAYRLVTFYEHLFDPTRSHLSAAEWELIAVITSAVNHCSYCVFNHTRPSPARSATRCGRSASPRDITMCA